ncbi:unnamed protein product [Allacma fusca]|uniref:Uncharacterized protein n=1 Tax=Allacma fusca TaxID=39272 RepID=A0A8J2PX41_9HEXA|nr:unnamed protein product [Allacma fusca]
MGTSKSVSEIQEFLKNLNLADPPNEPAVKIVMKDLHLKQKDNVEDLESLRSVLQDHLLNLPELSEAELLNLLQFFKIISEDPSHKVSVLLCPPETVLTFSETIFPQVTQLISKSSAAADNLSCQRSSSLLHKSVRISLNLVKVLDGRNNESLQQFGINFLNLVNAHPMAILDIKCNAGLIISHLISNSSVDSFIERISRKDKGMEGFVPSSEFETEIWKYLTADYVNRVSICFGAFGTRSNFSKEFMTNVAHAVLLQCENNSTKEAVNLGSGRVLEIWMDKVLGFPDLPELADILPLMEIFIFTYLAGHIDAVKNCCRNMLSNLSVAYSRLDHLGGSQEELLKDLIVKILAKPYHVKWVSLAAVARNNPESKILTVIWKNVAEGLLCSERTFKNAATDVYLSLMRYTFEKTPAWVQYWLTPLLKIQESQNNESNWSQKKSILTKALSSTGNKPMQKCILNTVITAMISGEDLPTESWLLIVECLKIGTELGVELEGEIEKDSTKFRGVLPRDIFNSWTYHSNPQIRLASLSLLIDTKKTSEIFSQQDFDTMRSIFKYNLVSQNPAFRQQFISYFKKLMRRLKDGRSFCKRKKQGQNLENYDKFLEWLWLFFTREGLFVGANFSRRCQSLNCLVDLLQNFSVSSFHGAIRPEDGLEYLRWLGDSYENNKIAAVEILSQLEMPEFQDAKFVTETFNTAMNLLTSVKPPESVTGRYLLLLLLKASSLYPWNVLRTLLTQLEQILYTLQKKTKSLLEVSSTTPPYGIIRAIRLIFETYKSEMIYEATTQKKNSTRPLKSGSYPFSFDILQEYVTRLLKVCLKLDDILFPVLGDAAPEGFLPDLNENSDITPENSKIVRSLNAQMLLVSSWRTMKEICILLTELCVNFPLEGEQGKEYVFVGFKSLAVRLKISKARKIQKLSEEWLEDVMNNSSDKCITRRSAGLPFVFQAILTPEVANEAVMTFWMKKLLEPDQELRSIMTVRIHSMNVLRALFRDANFARAIMEWVPAGIQLAFNALRANEWAEQNSGLMLYGSVIRRTFGPKLNLMSAPTFFRRFPQMYDFLLGEVKDVASLFNQSTRNPGPPSQKDNDLAYHLLLLFSCFSTAPGKLEEGNFRLSAFIGNIQACGCSSDIQVRTIAAKALVPFITSPEERQRVLETGLDSLIFGGRRIRNNKLHGDLLQLIAILNIIKSHEEQVCSSLVEKFQQIVDLPKNTTCPVIFETFGNLSICMDSFEILRITARTLQKINKDSFQSSVSIPLQVTSGILADASESISRSALHFLENDPDPDFISSANACILHQLLRSLVENKRILGPEGNMKLIKAYLEADFSFPGQTDFEISFLDYFCHEKLLLENFLEELLERMLNICEAEFGRVECKEKALRVAGKIISSGLAPSNIGKSRFCALMLEWTDSKYDDDLRLAVARALPSLPIGQNRYSPKEFCKLWTCTLKLAQDDELEIRKETFAKLPVKTPACSFKCIELVLKEFFLELQNYRSSEGLWTLLALLLKDDYEVVATVADDEDEDRLFDRSEMNMFAEKVVLMKIVASFLNQHPLIATFLRSQLDSELSLETWEIFLEFSNTNEEFQRQEKQLGKDTLASILGDLVPEKQLAEKNLEDLLRGHEKSTVQAFIRGEISKLFC